ncbi:hypothetical protein PGB90_007799 [Kerria lacca]
MEENKKLKVSCLFRCLQSSAEPISIPASETDTLIVSPKIESLVSEISKLTILEVSELSTALKKRLNLPDVPTMSFGAISQVAANTEEVDEAPKVVKTNYTVKLMKFDDDKKIAVIKEIKSLIEGLNLVQAKKFVESTPVIVKADINKEEAEKLKEALEKVEAINS